MQKLALALGILVLYQIQVPCFADSAALEKLKAYAQNKGAAGGLLSDSRGGPTTKKVLGFYGHHNAKEDITYHSGYEKQPAELTGRFANDLYEFVVKQGGGFANYEKDQMEKKSAGLVPYAVQAKFASDWWGKNCPQFPKDKSAGDSWVHDSLIDGSLLWTMYEKTSVPMPKAKAKNDYRDASRDQYHEVALLTVLKKQ